MMSNLGMAANTVGCRSTRPSFSSSTVSRLQSQACLGFEYLGLYWSSREVMRGRGGLVGWGSVVEVSVS